jgi:hypothetical protein
VIELIELYQTDYYQSIGEIMRNIPVPAAATGLPSTNRRHVIAGLAALPALALPALVAAPLPAVPLTARDWQEARWALQYEEQGLFKICWHPRPFAYDYIYPDGRHRTLTTMDPDTQPMIEALRQLLWQRENGEAQS